MLWQNLQRRKVLYQSCRIDAVLQRPGHNRADHFIQHVPLGDGKTRWNAFASWQLDYSPPPSGPSLFPSLSPTTFSLPTMADLEELSEDP